MRKVGRVGVLSLSSTHVCRTVPCSLHRVRHLHGQITGVVSTLNDKVAKVLQKQEKEFLGAYRAHMYQVRGVLGSCVCACVWAGTVSDRMCACACARVRMRVHLCVRMRVHACLYRVGRLLLLLLLLCVCWVRLSVVGVPCVLWCVHAPGGQVQKELQTLRAKANDAEQKLKKNDKIRVLEEEKEWYRKEVRLSK